MKCCACNGPMHPATGHMHTPTMGLCGPCARHMVAFVKSQMGRTFRVQGTKKRVKFYDYAASSIGAGEV